MNTKTDFQRRVDFAARIISTGGNTTRRFDACFENHDGDQVVTLLVRRARKNPRLDEQIRNRFNSVQCDWYQIAALREHLTNEEVEQEAEQQRRIDSNTFYLTWAAQSNDLQAYKKQ